MKDSLEKKVVDAILERNSTEIDLGGQKFTIAPASVGTLILVSELVAEIPEVLESSSDEELIQTMLRTARDMRVLGKIIATLILGAKRIKENKTVRVERNACSRSFFCRLRDFFARDRKNYVEISEVDYIANLVLDNVSPRDMMIVIIKRLSHAEIGDFFGLTTFLSGANLLKKTREVVATASGD